MLKKKKAPRFSHPAFSLELVNEDIFHPSHQIGTLLLLCIAFPFFFLWAFPYRHG